MEFEEVLRERRSIRQYRKKEIPEEKIRQILELANLSPSAGNLQARKIILIKDKKTKEKIARASLRQDFIAKAPVVFVICADPAKSAVKYRERGRQLYAVQDATIFAAYLQLAAASLGLASCWVGAFKEDEINEILALPENLKPIAVIPVGYPAEQPEETQREDLDGIIINPNRKSRR